VKYRKKTPLIEATQWFKNGDHPQDESEAIENSDPKVVQPFRALDVMDALDALNTLGRQYCPLCGNLMKNHGVLEGVNGEEYVCPSDYIVTDRNGGYSRLSRGEFESQYERYVRPPSHSDIPPSDLEARNQRRNRMKSDNEVS
jgi:hypothetical protein